MDQLILYGVDRPSDQVKKEWKRRGIGAINSIDVEKIALTRVRKLSNLLNEDYDIVDSSNDDFIGHHILRSVALADETKQIESWFINNEGAAFRNKLDRIRNSDQKNFLRILKRILFTERVYYLQDFLAKAGISNDEFRKHMHIFPSDVKKMLVIRWDYIPKVVHANRCALYYGFAIVDKYESTILTQAVHNYRMLLEQKIARLTRDEAARNALDQFESLKKAVLKEIERYSATFVGMDHIDEEVRHFPPCMCALDHMLQQGITFDRTELLQLGFFLREIGMTLNDYRRYWFKRHPNNKGKTWEEFSTSHWGSYELKHHYGAVGGGKKYKCYGCKTIQLEGFCPFHDWDFERLRDFIRAPLDEMYVGDDEQDMLDNKMKKIRRLCKKDYYGAACATEFKLRFKVKESDYVNHPIKNYYDPAKRETEKEKERLKKIEKEKSEKDEKQDAQGAPDS